MDNLPQSVMRKVGSAVQLSSSWESYIYMYEPTERKVQTQDTLVSKNVIRSALRLPSIFSYYEAFTLVDT